MSSWIVWLLLKPPAAGHNLGGSLVSLKVPCSLIWLQRPSPKNKNSHQQGAKRIFSHYVLKKERKVSMLCDMVHVTNFAERIATIQYKAEIIGLWQSTTFNTDIFIWKGWRMERVGSYVLAGEQKLLACTCRAPDKAARLGGLVRTCW